MRIFGRSSKPDIKELYSRRDVDGLIKALNHKEVEVRREAADALGRIGDERAIEPLIIALREESMRDDAAIALSMIGDGKAIEPLMEAFRGQKGKKFSAGDRVMFISKKYPSTVKPRNYPEKIILEYGKKATVIGEARYKGTDSRLVIVRWDDDSYRIYGDMVLIPPDRIKYLHKGVAKIDGFLCPIAFDAIEIIH